MLLRAGADQVLLVMEHLITLMNLDLERVKQVHIRETKDTIDFTLCCGQDI